MSRSYHNEEDALLLDAVANRDNKAIQQLLEQGADHTGALQQLRQKLPASHDTLSLLEGLVKERAILFQAVRDGDLTIIGCMTEEGYGSACWSPNTQDEQGISLVLAASEQYFNQPVVALCLNEKIKSLLPAKEKPEFTPVKQTSCRATLFNEAMASANNMGLLTDDDPFGIKAS